MSAALDIKLTNENQAWDLIKQLSTNTFDTKGARISFEDFPIVRIKYEGPSFNGTVSTRLCDVIYELQYEVNRIYALAVYGDETHLLSKDEKEQLEIFVKVAEGSSDLIANLGKAFNKMVEEGMKRMESKHIAIVLTTATVSLGGYFIADRYFQYKEAANKEAVTQTMTTQETERLKIIRDIVAEKPAVEAAISAGKSLGDKAVKAIKPDETVEKEGEKLNYADVREKFKRTRNTPEEIEFTGLYYVKEVKVSEHGEFFATLESTESGEICTAKIAGTESRLKDGILSALGSRQSIGLTIQGRQYKNTRKDCVIVSFGAEA
ncbi:hypothetical protein ACNQKP_10670 [Bdellovibrio bacteriovorus]|uniref:hypothetical protein n=1 Tax=Bdellovibrio bacteriovorus TaxID=959 RepID=UPI003AA81DCF